MDGFVRELTAGLVSTFCFTGAILNCDTVFEGESVRVPEAAVVDFSTGFEVILPFTTSFSSTNLGFT